MLEFGDKGSRLHPSIGRIVINFGASSSSASDIIIEYILLPRCAYSTFPPSHFTAIGSSVDRELRPFCMKTTSGPQPSMGAASAAIRPSSTLATTCRCWCASPERCATASPSVIVICPALGSDPRAVARTCRWRSAVRCDPLGRARGRPGGGRGRMHRRLGRAPVQRRCSA